MKHSCSQTNFFSRSMSQDILKSPPITNNTRSFFIKNRDINQNNNQFKHVFSSNCTKKFKSIFPREYDPVPKSLSSLKIRSFLKKDDLLNLPFIKRNKPVKVKSFNMETHNLHKEIVKSLSEKKRNRNELNDQINLNQSYESSIEEGNEIVENKNILEESSIRQSNIKALDLLNQFGFNQVYKDVLKFNNLPKESIIDEVYSTLHQKNTDRNIIVKKFKSSINNQDENNYKHEIKRFYFEEKIDPHIIIKNHHSWREVNINFSFPYFLKDQNLLFKIMEQNSEKLKKYNKLK
jgi:hypothetical protein